MPAPLSRPVKLLGWTSLFTDAATEAIYPLLPIFVTRVLGGTALSLGIIEGAAEAVSSVLKVVAGRVSDRTGRRKPFVVAGYTIAWLARPLIALAATWQHVFAVRLTDRIGKGLRGAPRDAMLGSLAPVGERGRVFGFHRAMDHAGAVIGPLVAAAFLWFFPGQYRALFALTFIPGALAVAMLFFVPETGPQERRGFPVPTLRGPQGRPEPGRGTSDRRVTGVEGSPAVPSGDIAGGPHLSADQPPLKLRRSAEALAKAEASAKAEGPPLLPSGDLPASLKRFLLILALFTLGNSTDAFLLLRLSDAGLATVYLPLVWAGLHVIKSGLSTAGGALSDRLGRRRLIVAGWALYAVVYAGFAMSESLTALLAWFFLYGIYFAMVEGSEKALVTDLTPAHLRGAAFGWYSAVLGFGALAASLAFGAIWEVFGPAAAFFTGAGLAVTAAVALAADRPLALRS